MTKIAYKLWAHLKNDKVIDLLPMHTIFIHKMLIYGPSRDIDKDEQRFEAVFTNKLKFDSPFIEENEDSVKLDQPDL